MLQHVSKMKVCLALSIVLAFGCNEGVVNDPGSQVKNDDSSSKSSSASSDDASKIDPVEAAAPVAIAGASLYLRCAQELFPSDVIFEALIGCRLQDALGQRKPASSVYPNFEYSWTITNSLDFLIGVKDLVDDPRYDSVYLFKSSSKAALDQGMKNVQIVFEGVLSQAPHDRIVGNLPDISVDAGSILEQGTSDLISISKELSRAIVGAQPTPPIP